MMEAINDDIERNMAETDGFIFRQQALGVMMKFSCVVLSLSRSLPLWTGADSSPPGADHYFDPGL